ncbi:MAG: hypothetical protein BWY93_02318 [Euryarchaeota archaeon ADurb.BinA087]|nr:MAG: hypothetical protein BWY93_02318 [Euryarchaeota archaeon ADurb.BinA087]
MALFDIPHDLIALSLQGELGNLAPVPEYIKGCSGFWIHQPGSFHYRIRDRPCQAAEVPDRLGKRVGIVLCHIARDPAVQGRPKVDRDAGIPEVHRCPHRSLLDPCHGKLTLHLVCHHLDASTAHGGYHPCYSPDKDYLIRIGVRLEFLGLVGFCHGGGHLSWRHPCIEAAIGESKDEGPHLIGRVHRCNNPGAADDEIQVFLDIEVHLPVALDEGVPHQIGDRLLGELCPIQGLPKDLLTGFGFSHIPAHLHSLVDHVAHAGLKIYPGKNALCRCVAHFDRCHNKIRFHLELGNINARTMAD